MEQLKRGSRGVMFTLVTVVVVVLLLGEVLTYLYTNTQYSNLGVQATPSLAASSMYSQLEVDAPAFLQTSLTEAVYALNAYETTGKINHRIDNGAYALASLVSNGTVYGTSMASYMGGYTLASYANSLKAKGAASGLAVSVSNANAIVFQNSAGQLSVSYSATLNVSSAYGLVSYPVTANASIPISGLPNLYGGSIGTGSIAYSQNVSVKVNSSYAARSGGSLYNSFNVPGGPALALSGSLSPYLFSYGPLFTDNAVSAGCGDAAISNAVNRSNYLLVTQSSQNVNSIFCGFGGLVTYYPNLTATQSKPSLVYSYSSGIYVNISVLNSQATGVPSNFQQMVFFNPSNAAYTPYESNDLGNIRFYQGNSELHSWCESGCNTISSSNAVFWVDIPSFTTSGLSSTIPITLTNNNGVTAAPFQQLVAFNPSSLAYLPYEASDLGNIRFYQGANELYSWCEAGCNTTGTSAAFWVKIPGGLAANSNTVINMTFGSLGTEYDGSYAGECPTCSVTGASVSTTNTHITFTSATASDPSGAGAIASPPDSTSLYICAGALQSNQNGGGVYDDQLGYSYSTDGDTDGDASITSFGTQTSNGCDTYSYYGASDPVVTAALSISGLTSYTFAGDNEGGGQTTFSSGGFTVTGYNSFVVLTVSCGFAACDNTPQANAAGSTGSVSVPAGCVLGPSVDYNGFENASIYTCNSLVPGSYSVTATNDGNTGGMEVVEGAYVFQNYTVTSIPINYGKYDNGKNVFTYYDNFSNSAQLTGWNTGRATAVANNGLIVTCTSGGQSYASCGVTYGGQTFTQPYVAEADMEIISRFVAFGMNKDNTPSANTNEFNPFWGEQTIYGPPYYSGWVNFNGGLGGCGTSYYGYEVLGFTAFSANNLQGFANINSANPICSGTRVTNWNGNSGYLTFGSTSTGDQLGAYWTRIRALPPNGIMPAATFNTLGVSQSAIISMTFISNSIDYDGNWAGEAPQLSCNNPSNTITGCAAGQYGRFDNGNSVFTSYQNFVGNVLPGSWRFQSSYKYNYTNNGLRAGTTSGQGIGFFLTPINAKTSVPEMYGGWTGSGSLCSSCLGLNPTNTSVGGNTLFGDNAGKLAWLHDSGTWYTSALNANPLLRIYGIYQTPTGVNTTYTYNYTSNTMHNIMGEPLYWAISGTAASPLYMQWFRTRQMPPNAIMPSFTFGGLITSGSAYSTTNIIAYLKTGSRYLIDGNSLALYDLSALQSAVYGGAYLPSGFSPSYLSLMGGSPAASSPYGVAPLGVATRSVASFNGVWNVTATGVPVNAIAGGFNTASFWVQWPGNQVNLVPFAFNGYALYITSNSIGFTSAGGNLLGSMTYGTSEFSTTPWVHIVAGFNNGVPAASSDILYINGVRQNLQVLRGSFSPSVFGGGTVSIGGFAFAPGTYNAFKGAIADVQLYNSLLTPYQAYSLYASGINGGPVNYSTLAGWWPLNGNLNDYSHYLNNGTATGTPSYSGLVGYGGSALDGGFYRTQLQQVKGISQCYSIGSCAWSGAGKINIPVQQGYASNSVQLASSALGLANGTIPGSAYFNSGANNMFIANSIPLSRLVRHCLFLDGLGSQRKHRGARLLQRPRACRLEQLLRVHQRECVAVWGRGQHRGEQLGEYNSGPFQRRGRNIVRERKPEGPDMRLGTWKRCIRRQCLHRRSERAVMAVPRLYRGRAGLQLGSQLGPGKPALPQ